MSYTITDKVVKFHRKIAADANHRLRSWDHCFTYFRNHLVHSELTDVAALNLGFYLASWGMYRGSSALIWKDYRIHLPAIAALYGSEYRPLWDLDFRNAADDASTADAILSLAGALKLVYEEQITTIDGEPKTFKPTDTLITKILLGTLACTPACDRYLIFGLQNAGLAYTRFDSRFLTQVFRFYRMHLEEFETARDIIQGQAAIRYPAMKLVDMYFWTLGWDLLSATEADDL
jgi:hypothetical protein